MGARAREVDVAYCHKNSECSYPSGQGWGLSTGRSPPPDASTKQIAKHFSKRLDRPAMPGPCGVSSLGEEARDKSAPWKRCVAGANELGGS